MRKKTTFLTLAGIALCGIAFGQSTTGSHTIGVTIPNLMIMDLEGGTAITLEFAKPTEPGEALVSTATDESLWLNYSFIKGSSAQTAKIDVKISTGGVTGYTIKVLAAEAAGDGGGGTRGISTGEVTLTDQDKPIVSGIGSSYTGNGDTNGHKLTYSVSLGTYTDLIASTTSTAIVTYTISAVGN